MTKKIPFVDLRGQHAALRAELVAAFEAVLDSQAYIQGPYAARFEAGFCDLLGVAPQLGMGVSNGTTALQLALQALGVGTGDEVVTVAHTFIATAEAISAVGAVPVFVDVEPGAYTMDPQALEAAITPRTRAVIAVHLYGTPCDMAAISRICTQRGLFLIEDSAQAHLATYDGRCAGTLGDAGCFSFYPGKNLGALGDAGFCIFRNEDVAARARKLMDHGRESKYLHQMVGNNFRMDGMQAALLSVKLPHLAGWTANRRRAAALYDSLLRPAGFKTIEAGPGCVSSYHLYTVEVADRDQVRENLQVRAIETGVHYPVPLHRQPAYRQDTASLPRTERAADRVLSLPMCGLISLEAVEIVAKAVIEVARP